MPLAIAGEVGGAETPPGSHSPWMPPGLRNAVCMENSKGENPCQNRKSCT